MDAVLKAFSHFEQLRVKTCKLFLLCPGPSDLGERKNKALAIVVEQDSVRDLEIWVRRGPWDPFAPQFFLLTWKNLSFPGV